MSRLTVVVDPSFMDQLRALRRERGLSYRSLGSLACYSHTLLWEVETGRKSPTVDLAGRLDEVLATGGVLSRLLAVPALSGPLTPDDEARMEYLTRHPGRIDLAAVDILSTLLAQQRRVEDEVGSASLIGPVTEQLAKLAEMVRGTSGSVRRHVVDVAAQWAQFAGWLNTSAGRPAVAESWFDRALLLATEAANRDLTSTILSFRGHLAWVYGDIGPMIGLTEAARQISDVYPGEQAYDALQAARGHAIAGDRKRVESNVAQSRELEALAREHTGPIPPWHYYRDESFFRLERGRVYRHLAEVDGFARLAIDELTAGLAGLEPVSYTASYLVDLAAAHALEGDVRSARSVLDEVESIAASCGSARMAATAERMRHRIS